MNELINLVWVGICTALVFFMQAGFALVEGGLSRAKNSINVIMKIYLGTCFIGVSFWVVGYGLAFFFPSLTLRSIPVGVAYAIWAGAGVVLVSIAGWLLYQQALDAAAILGIGLIVAGVLVINLFSKVVVH